MYILLIVFAEPGGCTKHIGVQSMSRRCILEIQVQST